MTLNKESIDGADRGNGGKPRRGGACLVMVGFFVGLFVVPVWGGKQWGQEVWRWAAGSWPGGVYWFAVAAGLAVPFLVIFLFLSLTELRWKSRKLRSLCWLLVALVCVATLELLLGVIGESLPFGGGKNSHSNGTETSRAYWGLWAVGFGATVAGIPLVMVFIRVYDRVFPPRATASRSRLGSDSANSARP